MLFTLVRQKKKGGGCSGHKEEKTKNGGTGMRTEKCLTALPDHEEKEEGSQGESTKK